jgi:glycosyltransferase involved in cell wall biosynthesis
VTPTLNAERYLPETIASVSAQQYPHLEHIVVDAGSTDATEAIVRASSARFIAAPGIRQAAAVNRGVRESDADVVMVLNADDVLYGGGVAALVDALSATPSAAAAYGEAVHIDAAGARIAPYPTKPFDPRTLIEECYICHPASAVRRAAFDAVGGLDEHLDVVLDYDFWIRLSRHGTFVRTAKLIAGSRMHQANKTLSRRGDLYREAFRVLRRHYGYVPYGWTAGYASWLLRRGDQFFTVSSPSPLTAPLALALGLRHNPFRPLKYLRDWCMHRAIARRR